MRCQIPEAVQHGLLAGLHHLEHGSDAASAANSGSAVLLSYKDLSKTLAR
jgi:hypothetical protein